jgi:hypothetical protein
LSHEQVYTVDEIERAYEAKAKEYATVLDPSIRIGLRRAKNHAQRLVRIANQLEKKS